MKVNRCISIVAHDANRPGASGSDGEGANRPRADALPGARPGKPFGAREFVPDPGVIPDAMASLARVAAMAFARGGTSETSRRRGRGGTSDRHGRRRSWQAGGSGKVEDHRPLSSLCRTFHVGNSTYKSFLRTGGSLHGPLGPSHNRLHRRPSPGARREDVRRQATPEAGKTTVWRALGRLVDEGTLKVSGKGRATGYTLAGAAAVRARLQTPWNRRKPVGHDRNFLDRYVPNKTFYLAETDRRRLNEAGTPVGAPLPTGTYAGRILERLLVDLSWASSRMEGNTYDLLEAERLIRFGREASGKDRKEAVMILNHKDAIEYVVNHLGRIAISRPDLCNVHALLADGLLIDPAMTGRLRRLPVAIAQSSYRPLGDRFAIEEEFAVLVAKAAAITDPFEQSFFLLVHIPYLQAFDDINKRTARVSSNIPLLKADRAPMSFLAMDDAAYIDGLIGVYELNDVSLLREAYIDAYLAAAEQYRVLCAEVETPERAALVHREFVREAVRRSVLDWKGFRPRRIMAMAERADIPEEDRDAVVNLVGREVRGLHEGNVIRYRLHPADLDSLRRERREGRDNDQDPACS